MEQVTQRMVKSRKYLNGARGQECLLNIPGVCVGGTETTVACHIRDESKGMGNKASDLSTVDGCAACHAMFDIGAMPKEEWLFYALRGLQRTLERRVEQELLDVQHDAPKSHTTPKPKSKRPIQSKTAWPKGRKIQSRGWG